MPAQGFQLRARSRNGPFITSIADWERLASTKGKWKDGFSAKELGWLWLIGSGAEACQDALQPVMPGFCVTEAVAEARVEFDDHPGGVRNHDVLAYGTADAGRVIVGVEGKVNESLDARISAKCAAAAKRRQAGLNTNLATRVDGLLDAILGRRVHDDLAIGKLRYQFFSGIAGTVAAADEFTVGAAFVVHLIETTQADVRKFRQTRDAAADFARAADASGAAPLFGPIYLKRRIRGAGTELPIWLATIQSRAVASTDRVEP